MNDEQRKDAVKHSRLKPIEMKRAVEAPVGFLSIESTQLETSIASSYIIPCGWFVIRWYERRRVKAFITYVRPILEYSSVVWSPRSVNMINSIESVQRRFIMKLRGMSLLTYDERSVVKSR